LKRSSGQREEKDAGNVVLAAALLGHVDEILASILERRIREN
jgi:hypothetical protein